MGGAYQRLAQTFCMVVKLKIIDNVRARALVLDRGIVATNDTNFNIHDAWKKALADDNINIRSVNRLFACGLALQKIQINDPKEANIRNIALDIARISADIYNQCLRHDSSLVHYSIELLNNSLKYDPSIFVPDAKLPVLHSYVKSVSRYLECLDLATVEDRESKLNHLLLPPS